MSESLSIPVTAQKAEKYQALIPQLKALLKGETDLIASLANLVAALKYRMGFFWVGFYLVKGEELVLGPFQGTNACTRIAPGKGVCGSAWLKKETILVPDVEKFPGHIACSSLSKSEIVVPVLKDGMVKAVLDVDSDLLNDFDFTDKKYLEEAVALIADLFPGNHS